MIELCIEAPDGMRDRVTFDRDELTIGRGVVNDLVLDHPSVRTIHACLTCDAGRFTLRTYEPHSVVPVDGAFAIGAYRVTLRVLPVESSGADIDVTEDGLIRSIETLRDDASREVYADWLEERGQLVRAEFLRLEYAARTLRDGSIEHDQAFVRLRELARSIAPSWRVRLACPPIRCRQRACPGHWGALEPTGLPDVRRCATCAKTVTYCWTHEDDPDARIVLDVTVSNRGNNPFRGGGW
jgi:uncharacterized protein (TIGR02996 family)